MPDLNDNIWKVLSEKDHQFRRWFQEHHQHESRLTELSRKRSLEPQEEREQRELKKKKLQLKDQMMTKIRRYESVAVGDA